MGFLQTTITVNKTTSFTPGPAATIYLIDATAGDLTVTLPGAARDAHSIYEFRRIDAGAATVTVAGATDSTVSPAVADTINGDASTTLAAGTALCLVSDGAAGWYDLSSTGGGGAATVEAPLTLTGTNPIQAPLSVVQNDTGTATAPLVLALTHSLSSGTAEAGLGAGLAFRLTNDDDAIRLAATLAAQWIDPAGTGELRLTAYDTAVPYTVRVMPTGVFVPNASAEPAAVDGGGVLYVEAGALKYKGSAGTVTTLAPA